MLLLLLLVKYICYKTGRSHAAHRIVATFASFLRSQLAHTLFQTADSAGTDAAAAGSDSSRGNKSGQKNCEKRRRNEGVGQGEIQG